MEIEGSTLTPEEMGYFHKTIGPDEVLIADDTYPAEPLGLKVYGNTRQNLWVNPSGGNVIANSDGSYTIKQSGVVVNVRHISYVLKPSTQYTVSVSDANCRCVITPFVDGKQKPDLAAFYGNSGTTKTFITPSEFDYIQFGVWGNAPDVVAGTYRVMLNEGSEAQPWCPPGLNSVSELEIALSPTNMWPSKTSDYNSFTSEYLAIGDDGFIGINIDNSKGGTAVYANMFSKEIKGIPVGDKVWLRVEWKEFSKAVWLSMDGTNYNWVQFDGGGGFQLDIGSGSRVVGLNCIRNAGNTVNCGVRLFISCGVGDRKTGRIRFGLYRAESDANAGWTPSGVPNYTTVDLQGNELCGLPDGTRDELDLTTGVLTKRVGKVITSGNDSNISKSTSSSYSNRYIVQDAIPGDSWSQSNFNNAMCDKLIGGGIWSSLDNNQVYTNNRQFWVGSDLDDVESFKDFFNGLAPMEVLYKLATPKTIQLAPPELPALPTPNLTAYAGSDVPCDMELEYVYDPYYGYSDLLHGMSWLRVDYDGDDASENYSSRVDLGGNRLFALSDELKDELDVISGTIRKRTMYGVLVGAESWSEKTDSTGSQHKAYYQMDIAGGSFSPKSDEQGGLFGRLKTKDPKSNDGPCAYCFANSTGIHIRMRPLASAVAGLDGFKDWLSQNHVPYVRYLFEGEEDLSIAPVNLPELYDPDVTVGISFG